MQSTSKKLQKLKFLQTPFISQSLTFHNRSIRTLKIPPKLDELTIMKNEYAQLNKKCEETLNEFVGVNPNDVFVNQEVNFKKIQVYGFDYDFTLANYSSELDIFIFNTARNWLVEEMKYPRELLNYEYSNFAVRGLHLDVKRGLLMKVDAFHHIQLDTVHRGFSLLSLDEVFKIYHGSYLSSASLKQKNIPNNTVLFQLMDLFVLPEVNLLCCIIDFFDRNQVNYQPINVYKDVFTSVQRIHRSGIFGQTVISDPEKYIIKDPNLTKFLHGLVAGGKKLFVISNSSAKYIDCGLKFLIGDNWRELFDVIITRANKPSFFQSQLNRFRRVNESGTFKSWEGVKLLERSLLYEGGSLDQLNTLTGWSSQSILYFGDHVYSDLADVSNTEGWMTAAVIPELEYEIAMINKPRFRLDTRRLAELEKLIQKNQHVTSVEAKSLLEKWFDERSQLRRSTKFLFHRQFGSIFRSFHNPSYFSQRLGQYATLYTSKVSNLLNYPLDHIFYPKRTSLPHEAL